jgi:propanediol dehydratase large subunit
MARGRRVLSAINDPNDYRGPGTGYRVSEARRQEINAIRDVLDQETVLSQEAEFARHVAGGISFRRMGPAEVGRNPNEVVVGVSPAFGTKLFRTMSGYYRRLIREIVAASRKARRRGSCSSCHGRHLLLGLSAGGSRDRRSASDQTRAR